MVLVSSPLSLFSRLPLFIDVLLHFLGLLGTACLRSARPFILRYVEVSLDSFYVFLFVSVSVCFFPKNLQNPFQKPSKIHPQNLENPPHKLPKSKSLRESVSGRIFVPILLRLGASLGPSWERLGASRGVLERLGSVLERLGRALEASWPVSGASWSILGTSWGPLGASWVHLRLLHRFSNDFSLIFQ